MKLSQTQSLYFEPVMPNFIYMEANRKELKSLVILPYKKFLCKERILELVKNDVGTMTLSGINMKNNRFLLLKGEHQYFAYRERLIRPDNIEINVMKDPSGLEKILLDEILGWRYVGILERKRYDLFLDRFYNKIRRTCPDEHKYLFE